MRSLIAILASLVSALAFAAPFATATVTASVTNCGFVLDGGAKVVVAAAALKCQYDLSSVTVGSHNITATAIINDPIWGNQESAPTSPLAFTRPAAPAVPTGLTLTP